MADARWWAIYTDGQILPMGLLSTQEIAERVASALRLTTYKIVPVSAGQVVDPRMARWYADQGWNLPVMMSLPMRGVWSEAPPVPATVAQVRVESGGRAPSSAELALLQPMRWHPD